MIRVIALAVVQREDGKLLLEKGSDSVKGECFYRCLGGGVDFGETGAAAIVREIREELGKEIIAESFLGGVENIFEWEGQPGHQVILFYRCRFADAADMAQEDIQRIEGMWDVCWRSPAEIAAEGLLLYPARMLEMLNGKGTDL